MLFDWIKQSCSIGARKGLWTKGKAGSQISAADKRLQRYMDVDAERRAKEKLQFISSMKGSKVARKERATDLRDADDKVAKSMNGADDQKNGGELVVEWQLEAERRLAAAGKTWSQKLGTSLQRWRGK